MKYDGNEQKYGISKGCYTGENEEYFYKMRAVQICFFSIIINKTNLA